MTKTYKKYHITFEQIWKPLEERDDCTVSRICIDVYSDNIDNAMAAAWQSVTVNPNSYEIVCAECDTCSRLVRKRQ